MSSDVDDDDVGIMQIRDNLSSIWSYEYDANGDVSSWKCRKTKVNGDWSTTKCSGSDERLQDMVPGRGYWLKMDEAAQLKGFGTQLAQSDDGYGFPGMPPAIDLPTNGWSLIGRYGILGHHGEFPGESPWDAGAIAKAKALESLTKLDNELHVFDVTDNAHLNEVNRLFNNEGYWLWIEDEAFNNAESESYAPLDKHYREELGCSHQFPK
jgi:hypothetical protein